MGFLWVWGLGLEGSKMVGLYALRYRVEGAAAR